MADKRIADFATLEEAQDDDLLLVSSEGETYNMKFGTFKAAVQGDADRAAAAAEAAKAAAQLATGESDEALKAAEDQGLTAGSDEYKQAVIDTIASMSGVEGITGTYTLDEYNNPEKSVALIQLQGGEEVFTEFYSFN